MDNITITNLKLNKGIDIKGKNQYGDEVYLTSGSTINETVNLINQYCDSYQRIVATFNVHPGCVKEDKQKYLIRPNLAVIHLVDDRRWRQICKNCAKREIGSKNKKGWDKLHEKT